MAETQTDLVVLLDRLQAAFTSDIVFDAYRAWRITEHGNHTLWSVWLKQMVANGLIRFAARGINADERDAEYWLIPRPESDDQGRVLQPWQIRFAVHRRKQVDQMVKLIRAMVEHFGEREFALNEARAVFPNSRGGPSVRTALFELSKRFWVKKIPRGQERVHRYRLLLEKIPIELGGQLVVLQGQTPAAADDASVPNSNPVPRPGAADTAAISPQPTKDVATPPTSPHLPSPTTPLVSPLRPPQAPSWPSTPD